MRDLEKAVCKDLGERLGLEIEEPTIQDIEKGILEVKEGSWGFKRQDLRTAFYMSMGRTLPEQHPAEASL